jgi:hypothetical protein
MLFSCRRIEKYTKLTLISREMCVTPVHRTMSRMNPARWLIGRFVA